MNMQRCSGVAGDMRAYEGIPSRTACDLYSAAGIPVPLSGSVLLFVSARVGYFLEFSGNDHDTLYGYLLYAIRF